MTLIGTPAKIASLMAAKPSCVTGILMQRFGRPDLSCTALAAAKVLALSWARSGDTSSETHPSTPSVRSKAGLNGGRGQVHQRQIEEQILARSARPHVLSDRVVVGGAVLDGVIETFRTAFLTIFADTSPAAPIGTVWWSSPWIMRVGRSNFFRSAVKSVSENALTKARVSLIDACIAMNQNQSSVPCDTLASSRFARKKARLTSFASCDRSVRMPARMASNAAIGVPDELLGVLSMYGVTAEMRPIFETLAVPCRPI